MNRITYLVAGLLASAAALPTSESTLQERNIGPAGRISSFKDIPSSPELHWTPCYKRFHCANLEVPLDYENPKLGSTVVAWIRLESENGTGTDIIFNPGGPGGSGVDYMLSGGDDLIKMTGGKYDIVSFDPRGVNASGIDLTCFPGSPEARDQYAANSGRYPTEQEKYAEAVAHGRWCSAVNNKTEVRYGGTVAVVQDMLHFTELQAAQDGSKKPKESLIWYYGVSYGTVIGQTLAALYPDRVGRVIVDANVNGEDHYAGVTDTAVEDADDGIQYFFKVCHEAGETKCPFAGKSSSPKDLEKRFNTILEKLKKEPLQSITPALGGPTIITKDMVLHQIFSWLYNPAAYFPYMAASLLALEKGNATMVLTILAELNRADDPGPFNYTSTAAGEVLDLVTAIDSAGRYPIKNVDEYTKAVDEIEKTSVWFGEGYATLNPLINAGMTIMPPKSQLFPGFKKTKTKNPLLFINTNADPITPLSSAKHMSTFFTGSVVLTQNSGGHSSEAIPSKCTRGHIGEYLASAKLPKEGTVCETDKKPLVDKITRRDVVVPLVRSHRM
ncbi:alpha/beta-hydrolase [Ophiobolus disseminans]|uniref:Alpha/beta-hydrolase n=1 Tax=Ophiobolus disseminans TaxID=1469910 RepID=A0A6A7AGJ0_9PLEO|nr:alpha/beta-hydrolase [Ophiobolus disseminans]